MKMTNNDRLRVCCSPLRFYSNFNFPVPHRTSCEIPLCFELMSVSVTDNMRNNIVRTREVRSGSCGPFYMNLPHALQLHT